MKTNLCNAKKAQINTMDFLTALFIFCLVLAYAIGNLNDAESRALSDTDYKYMIVSAVEISDALIKNPGIPESWNSTNVEFPGLAADDRVISSYKVDQFCSLTPNATASMFRIPYHMLFSLTGNRTVQCGPAVPATNRTKAVTVRRNVFFENKNAVLQVTLWK